jgi:hypothetical protein
MQYALGRPDVSEAEELRRGELLAEVLHLRKRKGPTDSEPRYQTTWGSKTALGLYRTVERIVLDGE